MAALQNALQGILTVLLMISLGFVLARRNWFTPDIENFIARFVTVVALPPYMVVSMLKSFSQKEFVSMVGGLVVPFISIFFCYLAAHFFAKVLSIPRSRSGVFCSIVYGANTVFIGLPLCTALFGDAGAPFVMLYYIANSALFWTLAVHDIALDSGKNAPLFSMQTVRAVLSPPLLGFAVGLIMVLLDVKLPFVLARTFTYIGNLVTPLAMIFVGIAISKGKWSEIKWDKEMLAALMGRFLLSPLSILCLQKFLPLPTLMGQVFVILAGMPAMTNTSIIAKAYGGDYQYAARITIVSTVLAALTIPFYMWLVTV